MMGIGEAWSGPALWASLNLSTPYTDSGLTQE